MDDLFTRVQGLSTLLAYLLAEAGKYIPVLAGGLNVLNGVLSLAQKLLELWEKMQSKRSKKGKNKRSTKRTTRMNP